MRPKSHFFDFLFWTMSHSSLTIFLDTILKKNLETMKIQFILLWTKGDNLSSVKTDNQFYKKWTFRVCSSRSKRTQSWYIMMRVTIWWIRIVGKARILLDNMFIDFWISKELFLLETLVLRFEECANLSSKVSSCLFSKS